MTVSKSKNKSKWWRVELVVAITLIVLTIFYLVESNEYFDNKIEPNLEECEVISSTCRGVDGDAEVAIKRLSDDKYYILSVGSNWDISLFISEPANFKSYNTMIAFNDDGTVYTTLGNFKNNYHKVECRPLDM